MLTEVLNIILAVPSRPPQLPTKAKPGSRGLTTSCFMTNDRNLPLQLCIVASCHKEKQSKLLRSRNDVRLCLSSGVRSLTVPGLRLSKMQIIDAVEIHVLCVPGKGTLPHAKIQVWCIHTFDLDAALILHSVQNSVELTNVPFSDILQRRNPAENLNGTDVEETILHVGKTFQNDLMVG